VALDVDPSVQTDPARERDRLREWDRAVGKLAAGAIVTGDAGLPDSSAGAASAAPDWLPQPGLRWYLRAVVSDDGSGPIGLELLRHSAQPSFGPAEVSLIERLMPHMQHAVRVLRYLEEADLERRTAEALLDRLSLGVILLDGAGRILGLNRAGERLLREDDGLGRDRDGIHTSRHAETSALHRLLEEAIRLEPDSPALLERVMTVSRPSCRRDLLLTATPIGRQSAAALAESRLAVALFVSDPEDKIELPVARLQRLYQLTPAEARLAATLGQGQTLNQAALELGLSKHTVRNQLKQIFLKTDSSRQSELVRLLLSGLPLLRVEAIGDSER
jgi:DNA-binding CsgD family transcriptional regulator/PAS domain-containing protein